MDDKRFIKKMNDTIHNKTNHENTSDSIKIRHIGTNNAKAKNNIETTIDENLLTNNISKEKFENKENCTFTKPETYDVSDNTITEILKDNKEKKYKCKVYFDDTPTMDINTYPSIDEIHDISFKYENNLRRKMMFTVSPHYNLYNEFFGLLLTNTPTIQDRFFKTILMDVYVDDKLLNTYVIANSFKIDSVEMDISHTGKPQYYVTLILVD